MNHEAAQAIADLRAELCRRLGHDWGEWRPHVNVLVVAAYGSDVEVRFCATCGEGEARSATSAPVVGGRGRPCRLCVLACNACCHEATEAGPVYDDHLCLGCDHGVVA